MTDTRTYVLVTSSAYYTIGVEEEFMPPVMTVSLHKTMESVHRKHLVDAFRFALTAPEIAEFANRDMAEITDKIVFHEIYAGEVDVGVSLSAKELKDKRYEFIHTYRGRGKDKGKFFYLMAEFKRELGKRFTEYVVKRIVDANSSDEMVIRQFNHVVLFEKEGRVIRE
jgi:hypothetical protein